MDSRPRPGCRSSDLRARGEPTARDTPAEPTGAYLDTNVLRDFLDGVSDPCSPDRRPGTPPATARAQLAAVRLVLYAPNRAWDLWVSEEGRDELRSYDERHGYGDWTATLFEDADWVEGAVPAEQVRGQGRRYQRQLDLDERHEADMEHLARAALTPWISVFVTNDGPLRRRARRLDDPAVQGLAVYSTLEAEVALAIRPGERPKRGFHPTHPLAGTGWWKL